MKTRDYQDLKKKDADELQKLVDEKRTEVMGLRFSLATGALEDPSRLGEAKRDVARLLTVLGDKRRAEAAAAKSAEKTEVTA
jgi:large subunit ribosomal protein L29